MLPFLSGQHTSHVPRWKYRVTYAAMELHLPAKSDAAAHAPLMKAHLMIVAQVHAIVSEVQRPLVRPPTFDTDDASLELKLEHYQKDRGQVQYGSLTSASSLRDRPQGQGPRSRRHHQQRPPASLNSIPC